MKKLLILFLIFTCFVFSQSDKKYDVKNLAINDEHSTFGTTYYKDNFVIFTTPKRRLILNSQKRRIKKRLARMNKKRRARVTKRIARRSHKILRSDLEFYIGITDASGEIVKSQPVNWNLNSKYDELDIVFTNSLKTVYFTRNISKKKGKTHLAIFKADVITASYWVNIIKLPFNNDDYSVGHPALNNDGTTMYFTSNKDGSLDIFKINILGENSYSDPINLGREINTNKTETTPFIKNDTLYYSSNGKGGFGNLDIFYVPLNSNKATNLGKSFNSNENDFAFKISKTANEGYFTSNNSNGKGKNDSYFFKELEEEEEEEDLSLDNVDINSKEKTTTEEKIAIIKESIPIKEKIVSKPKEEFIISKETKLTLNEYNKCNELLENVQNILFDYDSAYIRLDAARELDNVIIIMKRCPNIEVLVTSHTDSRSSFTYNKKLSQKRAASTVAYILRNGKFSANRVKGLGYGESRLRNRCKDGVVCSQTEHQINRRTEFEISNFY